MADVAGENRVALLDGGSSYHQVVKGQRVSFRRLRAFDLAHKPCGAISHRMNWHQADQFFDIFAAPLACCWRVRTIDSMDEFGDGHRRMREIDWPVHAQYCFD